MKRVFLSSLLLLLTGCAGTKQVRLEQRPPECAVLPCLTEEERARIHDISFPLQVQPTKLLLTESQMVLSFLSELSQGKLSAFYRTSMEYWGWKEFGAVLAQESCLIFVKPSKLCVITLRPVTRLETDDSLQTKVLVFIAPRET